VRGRAEHTYKCCDGAQALLAHTMHRPDRVLMDGETLMLKFKSTLLLAAFALFLLAVSSPAKAQSTNDTIYLGPPRTLCGPILFLAF
jgi:hypothetical protein